MASFSGNGRVTDQIMDYYLRYGRDRDLEKFLRLRAASTTRSSSDGSLPGLDELDRRGKVNGAAEKLGKSMENLSTLRQEEEAKERSRSREALDASAGSGKSDKAGEAAPPPPEVLVKESKSEKKSGRNFNFNLESVIEIKLPPPPAVQSALVVSPPQAVLAAPVIHEISTAGTQTMPEARSVEQQTEEPPIRPVLKPTTTTTAATLNPEDTIDTTRDISPVSSVASTKQKLEWDSLGDIGYDSNEKFYFCGASDLNETEKRCLQKYFAKKGLNFDEKIVVVKNVPAKRPEPEPPKETPKLDPKQKWQNVYQKYKEKYPTPSEVSLILMNPEAQSTPKPPQEVPPRPAKSTQTSLVKILTKAIQAEQIDTSHKQVGTETLSTTTNKTTSAIEVSSSSTTNCDQGDAAESFEFFHSRPKPAQVHKSSAGTSLKTSSLTSATSPSCSSSSSSSLGGMQQVIPGGGGAAGGNEYNFEDELRLGATLYNTICESQSLPERVKQSLIDKIFRKMVKNDPRKRSKQELLERCEQLKRGGGGGGGGDGVGGRSGSEERSSVQQGQGSGLSGVEVVENSGGNSVDGSNGGSEAGAGVTGTGALQVVEEDKAKTGSSKGSEEDLIVQNLQELSIKSNEATAPTKPSQRGTAHQQSASSSQRTVSSLPESSSRGTTKQRSQTPTAATTTSDIQASDQRIRQAMVDYLRPMTRSEVDYANQQDLQQQRRPTTTVTSSGSSNGDKIFALFRREKQSQLVKINKKIEHLKSMKLLLLEEQKAAMEIEGDARTTYPARRTSNSVEEKENLYENTDQRQKSAASAPVYTSVHGDTPSERSKDTEFSSASRSESAWNSHYHMKKMIQNRSKLETPTSDESIATFIKTRKDKFIQNYERHRKRMFDEQNHLYTKPYSGRQSKHDHYSRLDEKYSIRKLVKATTAQPSSDVFISSDSMSIPAANTLTNTTTHQYDIKSTRSSPESLTTAKATGTQTTSSILRTKPIFESKPKAATASVQVSSAVGCHCRKDCPCRHGSHQQLADPLPKHTERIDGTHRKQDKQQQTKPCSIAYVITFQGDRNKPRSSDSEKAQVYRSSSTDTSSAESNTEKLQQTPEPDLLPLKEQFKRNRPGTLARLKERQKCVNELNKLRSERNRQRKKLLLLTSDDSLKRCDVRQKLPPPPLAQKRIFSSKAIRENTRRQVRNLPEVLRKKEIEKTNNLKRKNLILRDKFNRNLQRKVLHGHVDLSNSVRIMQD